MNNNLKTGIAFLALAALAGCTNNHPAGSSAAPVSNSPAVAARPVVAGYRHGLAASSFHLGTQKAADRSGDFDRVVGADGVFATNRVNGAVFAVPNADSPAESAPALTTDAALHNDMVKRYFIAAGIPAEQIGAAHIGSTLGIHGRLGAREGQPTFLGYTTTLERTIDGYPVAESIASARFNANHDVVQEHVYWPELDASVIDEAKALDALVRDPVAKGHYFSHLPNHGDKGRVVIHHTSSTETSSFVAKASYDVPVGSSWRHFDGKGDEFKLPQETRPPLQTGPARLPASLVPTSR